MVWYKRNHIYSQYRYGPILQHDNIDSQKFLIIPSTFLGVDYSTRFWGYIILLVIDNVWWGYDMTISRAVT